MGDQYPRLNMPFVGIPSFCKWPIWEDLETLDGDVAVLGVPYDEGCSYRPGIRFAPRRIREMSLRYAARGTSPRGHYDIETGQVLLEEEVRRKRLWDCGDVDIVYTKPDETFANITKAVAAIRSRGAFPVVLGGDHSISFPVVRALTESPIDIVQIDAHLDFADNVAGVTHAGMNPLRRISELPTFRKVVSVGIRGLRNSKADHELMLAMGNVVITASEIRRLGARRCIEGALPLGNTYVTVDIDGLDPSVAPGCSGSEPGGLSYLETKEVLSTVVEHATSLIGFDLNEVNPMIDLGDMTSGVAAQLALEFLGMASSAKSWSYRKAAR